MEEDETLSSSPTLQNIKRNREVASEEEEIRALEESFSGGEDDIPDEPTQQEKGNMFTESIKDIPGSVVSGMARAVQETGNFAIDTADWLENFASEQGLGDGDLINEGSRITALTDPSNVYQPRTTTGHLVAGISQFLLPFSVLGKISKGVKVASVIGKFAKASALGAAVDFTAFDPKEERLSNLIQRHTPLRDPITSFLATNPKDTRAEGRLKNAIEGLGIGLVFEGLLYGLKTYRAHRVSKAAKTDMDNVIKLAGEKDIVIPKEEKVLTPEPVKVEGEPAAKQVDEFGEIDEVIKEVKEARKTPRIESSLPDTPIEVESKVLAALEQGKIGKALTASRDAGQSPSFGRGEVPIAKSHEAAKKLGMTPEEFIKRKEGGVLNDAEVMAMADAMDEVTGNLKNIANKMDPNNPADLEILLDEFDLMDTLVARDDGFGEEMGRAFNARKKLKRARDGMTDAARNRQLADKAAKYGGTETAQRVKDRIAKMEAADFAEISKRSFGRKLGDAVYETWINGLLSRPMTQIRNIGSNASVIAMDIVEAKVAVTRVEGRIAEAIASTKTKIKEAKIAGSSAQEIEALEQTLEMLPTSDRVFKGEAEIQIEAIVGGFKDALKMSHEAFKSGKVSTKSGKVSPIKVSSDFFRQEINKISSESARAVVSTSIDVLGKMTTLPGRTLYTADEFFKGLNMRKEVHRLAHREASLEGLQNGWSPEQVLKKTDELIQKPSETIITGAEQAKLTNTFQTPAEELELFFDAAALKNVLNNPIGKVITPFINTNLNLLDFSMRRAPFKKMNPGLTADLLEGGAKADLAKARIALSYSTLAVGASLTLGGAITGGGPVDFKAKKLWLEAGNVPYSFNVPGIGPISFDRFDPLGKLLGASADTADLMAQLPEGKASDLALGAALMVGRFITPEFATESLAPFLDLLRPGSDTNPLKKFITGLGSSAVPLSGFVSEVRKVVDTKKRDTSAAKDAESPIWDEFLNNFKNTIPGYSDSLPGATNIFGEDKVYYTGFGDSNTSPTLANKADDMSEYVSGELLKLGMNNPMVRGTPKEGESFLTVDNPSRIIRRGGVSTPLSPVQYEKYKKLAGGIGLNEAPFPGMTLKEALNEQFKNDFPLAEGSKSDEMKRIIVKKIISGYRRSATAQFFEEDDNIFEKVQRNSEAKSNAILGLEN